MRTLAQKQHQPHERVSSTFAPSNTATSRQNFQPHTIMHLLSALGNQAVLRLLQANAEEIEGGTTSTASPRAAHDFSLPPTSINMPVKIQTSLAVNSPGDIYEQEADRVSEQVMRMPEPQLQRACACGGGCSQCQTEQPGTEHEGLQTKRVGSSDWGQTQAPPVVHEVLSSPGQPLDTAARDFIEPRFGHDFGQVRVHTDEKAAESAQTLRARAYTLGRHIVFAQGQYRPHLTEGRRLLAHELAHVAQQQGSGRPALQLKSELESFPEEERKKVRVLTGGVDAKSQNIIDQHYLSRTGLPIPAERTVTFAASVADFRRKGLTNVAAALTTPSAGEPQAILPRNSAIDLAIPAAQAVFRFSRFDRPSTVVAGAAGPMPEVVLVEEVGVIPREPKPLWEAFPGPFSEAQGPLPAWEAWRMRDCLAGGAHLDYCRREVLGLGAPEPAPVVLKAGEVGIPEGQDPAGPRLEGERVDGGLGGPGGAPGFGPEACCRGQVPAGGKKRLQTGGGHGRLLRPRIERRERRRRQEDHDLRQRLQDVHHALRHLIPARQDRGP